MGAKVSTVYEHRCHTLAGEKVRCGDAANTAPHDQHVGFHRSIEGLGAVCLNRGITHHFDPRTSLRLA